MKTSYSKRTTWEDVENLLCQLEKSDEELERILPWFYEHVKCFKQVKEEAVKQIITKSDYAPIKRDHVIVRQGDVGDCCYIILKGTVSVYAKRTEDLDNLVHDESGMRTTIVKNHKERSKFGAEVAVLKSGDKFGDLCFYKANKERNATVIADENLHLLIVDCKVYQGLLADRYLDMRDQLRFMQTSPLFKGFPYDYRVTLLEKMRARRLHYGSAIVRQGDLVKSITIICRGEALLKMNPKMLNQQYELGGDQKPLTIIQKRREIMKRGYVAAEEILKQKNVTVATLGACEIIGDVEFVLGRSKHHITALANTEILVMDMELGELQRLMAKRDGGISDFLFNTVLCKLGSRADRCTRVPQYRALYDMAVAAYAAKKKTSGNKGRFEMQPKTPVSKFVRAAKFGTTLGGLAKNVSAGASAPQSHERSNSIAAALKKTANVAMEIASAKLLGNISEGVKKHDLTGVDDTDAIRTKKAAAKARNEGQGQEKGRKQLTAKEYRVLKKKMQAAGKTIRPMD
ncbi:uncharacterized protein LOC114521022 [Dendronephthya gigantea]|uniref:uncharacterized protein LOC114521022 n=1 Tax=Dendronephthya gigantea TaxID=151771 RepID=UPI00106D9CA2|nr:uncharacterized protein LOC114521022 [Dendronephthya gigantea]